MRIQFIKLFAASSALSKLCGVNEYDCEDGVCWQQINNCRLTSAVKRFLSNFCVISVGKWNLEGKDSVLCVHDEGKGHELYCPE